MKYLKIEIEKMLMEICPNVFLEDAEDDSIYPYLVYTLSTGTKINGQMVYFLDVDIWDKNETTENIDELEQKVKKLDGVTYIDENVQFTVYFDRLLNAKSEAKEWKRYTCTLEVRAIERR